MKRPLEPITDQEYKVTLKREGGLLRYFVVGERNFQASYHLWKRIYRECSAFNIYRVHVTVMLNGVLDKMEIPLLIQKLIELNASTPITCAWVDHNATSYFDNLIAEKIPRPESMNIRIFKDDQEAERWLLDN